MNKLKPQNENVKFLRFRDAKDFLRQRGYVLGKWEGSVEHPQIVTYVKGKIGARIKPYRDGHWIVELEDDEKTLGNF